MEKWRAWGLSWDEWQECRQAADELAAIGAEHAPDAEQIAAQLAVAKAAESDILPGEPPSRSFKPH